MISETYNSIADLYKGIAKKTQNLIDKLNNGQKITKRETKELEELKKQAANKMNKSADYFLKSLGNEGSQPILDLIKAANESCVCDLETEEVKKGPVFDDIFVNLEDCKKCLEEKKQEQAALLAKAFEKRYKSMKNKEMTCGCLSWGNFLQDISIIDGLTDCEEIVSIMNKAKADLSKIGSADFSVNNLFFDENKPTGQVSIGNTCIDNFSLKANPNSASIVVNSDKKTQYNDPAVEISNNNITITDYSNPGSSLVIGTDDNEQAKLVEKWLFEEGKGGKKNNSTKITIYRDKVSPEFLKKVENICTNLRIEPNYLMACMAFETGETFSPCIKNPGSSATGLIQFMKKTAENLGTTTDKLCKMTAEEQLDYVEKYFLPYKGKIHSIADIYMVIFCPKGVGKDMSYTLYPPRQIDYDRNKGLDKDKNKEITKQEAYNAVKGKLEKGLN